MANTTQSFYSVKDVPAADFIKAYAEYLKKNDKIKIPAWLDVVKTSKTKELSPLNEDWLYIRAGSPSFTPASLARKIYVRGHTGVGLLKHMYGELHRTGSCRGHHSTVSGKVIRYCLQQLEEIKVLKKDRKSSLKMNSRVVSDEGRRDMNLIANEVAKKSQE